MADPLLILHLKVRCWPEASGGYVARVMLVDYDGKTLRDYPVASAKDQPNAVRHALEEATRWIAAGELGGARPSGVPKGAK